jgi:hypothetical protein
MVLGVAFIAVPAQFAADGLSRSAGFSSGSPPPPCCWRLLLRPRGLVWALLALLWLIVAAQDFWLLPARDARADLLLQGQEPPPGPWHGLYVGAEITKLAALVCIALGAARRAVSR